MSMTTLICADVESRDLAARYVAGTLPAADAAEYEAHYFGCESCWASLRRATEVRAAFASGSARPRRRARTWGAAAAAVLVVAVGVGVLTRDAPGDAESTGSTLRSGSGMIDVVPLADAASRGIAWGPVVDAEGYLVRLYRTDGELVAEREARDTSFVMPADSVTVMAGQDTLYWQVLALDRLRQPFARSALTAVSPSTSP